MKQPGGRGDWTVWQAEPGTALAAACERVLRSLPMWFGREDALLEYVDDASVHPTYVIGRYGAVDGFLTLRRHFAASFEVHCMAVLADRRGRGAGRALVDHAQAVAAAQGGRFLQVKTVDAGAGSAAYEETRGFYRAIGFTPLESHPTLWDVRTPCLQLVKHLPAD